MAEYMVVDAEQLESDLTVVADAIRAKAGTEDSLAFPHGMKAAIEGISSEPQIDGYLTIEIGETTELGALSEDSQLGTPTMDSGWYSTDNGGVIGISPEIDWYVIEGLSEGTTMFTMNYQYEVEDVDEYGDTIIVTKERTLRYVITVTSGGGGGGAVTTFYIDYYDYMSVPDGSPARSTTLQFEEGMTWENWVGSSYNTIGASFEEMDYENHLWVDGSSMYFNVKKTSIIGEWATYKACMY